MRCGTLRLHISELKQHFEDCISIVGDIQDLDKKKQLRFRFLNKRSFMVWL